MQVLRFLCIVIFGCIGIFGASDSVYALSMSPPELIIETPLTESDEISADVSIGRLVSQVGALTVQVSTHGPCTSCITSDAYFVIPSTQTNYTFPFSVSAGELTEGSYTQYLTFSLYTETGEGSGSASATVQHGVTLTIRFSVAAGVNVEDEDISSGGGGGGGTGGSRPETADEEENGNTGVEEEESDTTTSDESLEEALPEEDMPDSSTSEVLPSTDAETSSVAEIITVTQIEENDVFEKTSITLEQHFSGTCTATCDVNRDGVITFTDVVLHYVYGDVSTESDAPATPPMLPGPPYATDDAILSIVPGDVVGMYDFQLLAANEPTTDNLATFYLVADTGPVGILASEVYLAFDSSALRFAGVDTVGSIFPFVYSVNSAGMIHFSGITKEAFIGTNGYVAAFRFEPLQEGRARIMFQDVAVFQPTVSGDAALILQDIEGMFMRPVQKNTASTPSNAILEPADADQSSSALLRVLFLVIACSAGMSATYLLSKKPL